MPQVVLNEIQTLQMLQSFCYEALKFLKVSSDRYPKFCIGGIIAQNGKIDPLAIDYDEKKVFVFIPLLKSLIEWGRGNDSPTLFRMMGYQLARFWQRYLQKGLTPGFDIMDNDSVVFANSLMVLKGLVEPPIMTTTERIIEMLKSEFDIECMEVECYEKNTNTRQKLISYTSAESERMYNQWHSLWEENKKRPIANISEGHKGSKTNPFSNIDEAAQFVLQIEQERLETDSFRQAVACEDYYYDGSVFRIPWASANVSYYPIEGASRNCFVVNQLSTHARFSLKPSLAFNKFLYRGQSQQYPECKPGLYRKKKDYYVEDMIQINEMECLLKTHPLVRLFEEGFQLFNDSFRFKISYIGLSQHYYNKTNLLDLTSNMDVAKFFAVTDFDMEQDKYIKYTGDKLGILYYYDLKADSFHKDSPYKHIIETVGKQPFMRSGNQSGFTISLDKEDNFDMLPNVRYVFFRHDPSITDRIYKQFKEGDIIMPDEILRTHWHNRMKNEDSLHIVSYDALKLNFERNRGESHSKIQKYLKSQGYRIKNYHPAFTDDELDIYYSTAIKFWEEFCRDIFFYSPEGMIMKEYLHNLPDDPRYRWAFVR